MLKARFVLTGVLAFLLSLSCNDGMSSAKGSGAEKARKDRSQRTEIDNQEYFDFTVPKYDARVVKIEEMFSNLNNGTYKNGNSIIKVKTQDTSIEISSDAGFYNGRRNCQVYGKFAVEIKAASSDCLYLRKDPRQEGFVMIDGILFNNEAVPDLAVCIPLYGYSRNRIEVSNIMDGFILMPSGTYWK